MIDAITPPSIIPINGTTSGERSGIDRRIARKIPVPISAVIEATTIFRAIGAPGASNVMTRIPRLADSTVPAVVGETNRFRDSICIIMPTIPVDAPMRTMAIVRGIRLTSNTIWESSTCPVRASRRLKS